MSAGEDIPNPEEIAALFHELEQLDGPSRTQILDEKCATRPALRREVEELLDALPAGQAMFDQPPVGASHLLDSLQNFLVAGRELGPFRIEQRLSEGGMGLVFRALDTRSNKVVALKLLAPELAGAPQWQRRFLRESAALRTLNHPGIVKLFESGEHEGFSYFTMELIDGETLAQRMQREKPSIVESVTWSKQILDALSAAHHAGFLHGDLKPQNIMLDSQGRIRLLDFGLTRTIAANLPATQTSSAVTGTVEYLSPERIAGATPDERSDLFSVGVLLYEFLSGHTPFTRSNPLATAAAILHEPPPPLPAHIPPALATVVQHCLEKEIPLRPASASDLAAELEQAYLARESFVGRHKWLLAAIAAVLAVLAVLLIRRAATPSVVDLTVPAIGDIWLAGQPSGAKAVGLFGSDSVPTNAPASLPVTPGHVLTFAATGNISVDGRCYADSPDGGCYDDETPFGAGPANGISSYLGQASALVGVFLDLSHPSTKPPPPLDFRSKTNFSALSPKLGQIFFIGDGLTGTGKGARQRFTVPRGASQLFLAAADSFGSSSGGNVGRFLVTVTDLGPAQ